MTTRQISEFLGKPESTVRRWASKASLIMASASLKLVEAQKSGGIPADWDIEETCMIIEIGLGKNASDMYRMNAKAPTVQVSNESTLTAKDMDMISRLTAGIVSAVMANLDSRVQKIETRVEQRQALLPAPQIKPRDHVNKIVREYTNRTGTDIRDAWRTLYIEFGYRTNSNPSLSAKNRGMKVIDYIEVEQQIGILEAVALEIMA